MWSNSFLLGLLVLLVSARTKEVTSAGVSQLHQPYGANALAVNLFCHSVSPTKLPPTLPVHTTKSYAQNFTLYAFRLTTVSSA